MPKFVARLEAQDDSGHYRRVTGVFDSEDEFRMYLEHRELEYAMWRLDTDELAALEEKEAAALAENPDARPLGGKDRAELAIHRQAKPYLVVDISEEE